MKTLQPGGKAPNFQLTSDQGVLVKLTDFKGSPFVLYFYPKDDTPGCTTEACQFNDNLKAFNKAKVKIVGVSPDGPESHAKFKKKYGLKFDLLSDPGLETLKSYGAYGEKNLYGKKTVGVIRSTFLISPEQKVVRAWYNVKAKGHAEKVLEAIAEL
jgi:peroxiredoxin Q/BCP